MPKKLVVAVAVLLLALAVGYFLVRKPAPLPETPLTPVETPSPVEMAPVTFAPTPLPVAKPVRVKNPAPTIPPPPANVAVPPPVVIHKELIPKDIEIVRVYYENQLTGPDTEVEFDINGSGFNAEFEKMITVESGSAYTQVQRLKLVTPNQIHGVLQISKTATTSIAFPQILIQGKVVFRAPEPFAMIRPGEVLNVILMEMGENGRTGRVRVFTNLSEELFARFHIEPSTTTIEIRDVQPHLPYLVDATIDTGWRTMGGDYDLRLKLDDKVIFERKGFIRIVKPNVGQSGLVQQVKALDGFHRPGDRAGFSLMGSGFQPQDAQLITVKVDGFQTLTSSLTYVGPGRMDLVIVIPPDAPVGHFPMELVAGETSLLKNSDAFWIVDKNWARMLELNPPLVPGGHATLVLSGRDLDKEFVEKILVETDESTLKITSFRWVDPSHAQADIEAGGDVAPGDYLLKMTSGGQAVNPAFGSIIRIKKAP